MNVETLDILLAIIIACFESFPKQALFSLYSKLKGIASRNLDPLSIVIVYGDTNFLHHFRDAESSIVSSVAVRFGPWHL